MLQVPRTCGARVTAVQSRVGQTAQGHPLSRQGRCGAGSGHPSHWEAVVDGAGGLAEAGKEKEQ